MQNTEWFCQLVLVMCANIVIDAAECLVWIGLEEYHAINHTRNMLLVVGKRQLHFVFVFIGVCVPSRS